MLIAYCGSNVPPKYGVEDNANMCEFIDKYVRVQYLLMKAN